MISVPGSSVHGKVDELEERIRVIRRDVFRESLYAIKWSAFWRMDGD